MVLRLVVFLGLVALGLCQDDTTGPMEGSAMEIPLDPDEVPDLTDRYEENQAVRMRQDHFYCLDVGLNQEGFPNDTVGTDGGTTFRRWALFLQYPILNYLETLGKLMLLRSVAGVVQAGDSSGPLNNFNESAFCIANVYHYGVSTYEESILINFYFEDETMDIMEFDAAFRDGLSAEPEAYVTTFLGRRALIVTLPGHSADGLAPESDPTQRAVVLGSYMGNTDIEEARSGQMQSFAENPNPINFGLEAGDIVFAVIGSVFLAIVGGLIVLGFCIHPFFLA